MPKKTIIKCPVCGCEYLAAEIFDPHSFVGEPKTIVKDENGEILGFDGEDMDVTETYICDKCNTEFQVEASVVFKTSVTKTVFDDNDEFVAVTNPEEK